MRKKMTSFTSPTDLMPQVASSKTQPPKNPTESTPLLSSREQRTISCWEAIKNCFCNFGASEAEQAAFLGRWDQVGENYQNGLERMKIKNLQVETDSDSLLLTPLSTRKNTPVENGSILLDYSGDRGKSDKDYA